MSPPADLTASELAGDSAGSKIDLRAYWRTIRKRWPFVVLSMIVATVIAFVYTYRQPKVYEATCQVIIEPMAPQVLPGSKDVVELGTGSFWANKEFYETQYRIIQSTSVGQRTAEKLGLQYDPDYAGVVGPNHDLTALGRAIAGQLTVKPLKDSRLALITVSDGKPQRAALIANTVADTYIEYNLDYKLEGARSAMAWLAEQESELKRQLEESELKLYQYKKDRNLLAVSLDDKQSMLSQNLANVNCQAHRAAHQAARDGRQAEDDRARARRHRRQGESAGDSGEGDDRKAARLVRPAEQGVRGSLVALRPELSEDEVAQG